MNADQKKYCIEVAKGLLVIFPDISHGNIFFKFNVNRDKKVVNLNVGNEESVFLLGDAKPIK